MDAQTFMYWALGAGFLLLVLFLCIAIYHLIRILKDVADATDSVKDTAEKIDESVGKITEKINETADQITEYVVKPFTVIQYITEKAKPIMDMIQKKGEELNKYADGGEEEGKPRKKRRFGRRK
jgi:uncharacterized protein YoxC